LSALRYRYRRLAQGTNQNFQELRIYRHNAENGTTKTAG
jgi:hypothetical protein